MKKKEKRLRGRAEFCRDRGEVKTPELLEHAAQLLEEKAQTVPEVITIGNELQSWVAVNSFSADDGEGVLPVVDANAIAEKIEELLTAFTEGHSVKMDMFKGIEL